MQTTPKEQAVPPFTIAIIDLIDAYHYADFFDEERYAWVGMRGVVYPDYDKIVALADRLFWALNPDDKTQRDWCQYDMGYDIQVYDANHNCVYKAHEKLPDPEKTVWFIRHAESQSNADKSFKSDDFASATVPLSKRGLKQAEKIADGFFFHPPDLIITSPYERTKQTAEPLMKRYPDVPVEEWPIQEFTYLSLDRCVGTTISERKPWTEEYWQKGNPFYSDGDGAESWMSFMNRASDIVEEIKSRKERFIVLFSHEYFIAAIKYILNKEEYEITPNHIKDFRQYFLSNRIPNASKVEFTFNDCQTPD